MITKHIDLLIILTYSLYMDVKETLKILDQELKGSTGRDLFVCGGAAMIAMGAWERVTYDIDTILPRIDEELLEAARRVASKLGLSKDWLNNGPDSLIQDLEKGWRERVVELYRGENLSVYALGKADLIKTKLWATCDRMEDIDDILFLSPTHEELSEAKEWVLKRDASAVWPQIVEETMKEIERRRNG